MWDIEDHDRNALVVDRSFRPHLYAISKEGSAPATISDVLHEAL